MKYILLMLLSFGVQASEVSLSLIQRSMMAGDDSYNVDDWSGLQFNYQTNDELYLFISTEQANVAPNSYFAFTYDMTGFGLGTKHKLTPTVNLTGQLGYYIIENSWGHQKRFNESLYYYMNKKFVHSNGDLGYYYSEDFEVKNSNSFGASVGVEMNYPLTKNLTLNMGLSYRAMKIKETFIMRRPEWTALGVGQWWENGSMRDYSSMNSSIGVSYAF